MTGRRRRQLGSLALVAAATVLGGAVVASLLEPAPGERSRWTSPSAGTTLVHRGETGSSDPAASRVADSHVESRLASASALAAGRSLALAAHAATAPAVARARSEADAHSLEAMLTDLANHPPRGRELMSLRHELERLLRARPDLAPAVARAFDRLDDRLTLFALSRALVTSLADPEVRSKLEADARSSTLEARREIALRALAGTGDPALVELERATLADSAAPASVRAAAADGLALDRERADPSTASNARSSARELAATGHDPLARESALHLLASAGPTADDARLARSVLADPSSPTRVALAAARVALAAGDDRAALARALADRSRASPHETSGPDLLALAAERLATPHGDEREDH